VGSGLPIETVFLCFQLRSLDPRRFPAAPAGRLKGDVLQRLEDAPPRHEEPQNHRHRMDPSLAGGEALGALRQRGVQVSTPRRFCAARAQVAAGWNGTELSGMGIMVPLENEWMIGGLRKRALIAPLSRTVRLATTGTLGWRTSMITGLFAGGQCASCFILTSGL
jgi:hypothetical protein